MQTRNAGLRRYMYEYMIARTINRTSELIGSPILVSQGRHLRDLMEERLNENGRSFNDGDLGVPEALDAIQSVMSENVPGYKPLFQPADTSSKGYKALYKDFTATIGLNGSAGAAGPRLPISPYDPRWGTRRSVKQAGSSILYILDDDIAVFADGKPSNLEKVTSSELKLYRLNEDGDAKEAGQALSLDDISGLTELMGRMTTAEYNDVRQWVLDGARNPETGRYNARQFMSTDALARSRAVLDMLAEEGIPYTIEKDLRPGQIRARLTGTNMTVRLTDTREKEQWVGRVYDNGATLYFSTTARRDNKQVAYTPTVDEVCDLVRVALGRPVERKDGKGLVGHVGQRQSKNKTLQESYLSTDTLTSAYKDMPGANGEQVVIRRQMKERSASSRFFVDTPEGQAQASTFITDAVRSARINVEQQLDVDGLIRQLSEHEDAAREGTYVPVLSGDPDLAAVGRAYWDVLRGAETTLLKLDATRSEYAEATGLLDEMDQESDLSGVHDMLAGSVAYTGSPEERVRAHLHDLLDTQIGVDAPIETDEFVFDPVRVGRYMTSEYGQWRNNDDLVAAMRTARLPKEKIVGESFYSNTFRDRLITFDESTALSIDVVDDEFTTSMLQVVSDTLESCAVTPGSIRVDANGVVEWTGSIMRSQTGREEPVSGTIGQIFARGENGEIITRFNSGNDLMIVPGFEARVVSQKPGENKSLEERTRLIGYEQQMSDAIRYRVQADVLTGRSRVGEPASLNGVYRRLTDTRHRADHYERALEEGMDREILDAILATEARRVRYPNALRDGSTIDADFRASRAREQGFGSDPANDTTMDPWVLTGGRNMSLLSEEADGYFDPIMTSSGVNQGVTRYLVSGAQVNADGSIVPSDKGDRAPLMLTKQAEFMSYDPFDRQQMTTSNLMNASSVTKPVGTAFMTAGGWTMEDSIVVSADFARQYRVRGTDGEMRDLIVGDKISDMHGNKGVISLIVDRDASLSSSEIEDLYGSTDMMDLFRQNPDLDVVMAPFSAVSRFNGGSAREAMQSTAPLYLPNGEVVENGIGQVSFIGTHMTVDAKTAAYDDAAIRAGQGRKASSQLAWALQSQGCDKVLEQIYGGNLQALAQLREMALVCGLDIEPDGTLREGHDDLAVGGQRRLIEMGEVPITERGSFDVRKVRSDFAALIGDAGGDMEIPFPLTMPTGERTPHATDTTWRVPVLSSHLRSGQDLDDGSSTVHDYTYRYLTIREWALRYKHAADRAASGELTGKDLADARQTMAEAMHRAQTAYDGIAQDIMRRRFTGKHNVFKEGLMASRLPRSATAVWTGDPRLNIDQVGVGPELAKKLRLRDGDYALIWRDPVLRDAGIRYMRVSIDERLTGVSVNPNMVKCFDGDFDGDSVAVVNLGRGAAHEQALERLSVEANLLDLGQGMDDEGCYPLAMHDALDVKVSQHYDFRHGEAMAAVHQMANDVYYDFVEGESTRKDFLDLSREVSADISRMYHDALRHQYGEAVLSFGSVKEHMDSVEKACIETGAKGSPKKMLDYAKYIGYDPKTGEDLKVTQVTRNEQLGTMYATAVKSFGTGVAGTFSQRGVRALRNNELKAVLELTYPVTQSILQAKHDPVDARHRYELLMGPARSLWRGQMIAQGNDGVWNTVLDSDHKPVQATKEQWVEVFSRFYGDDGLGVAINAENIEKVATALSDSNGVMLNLEDEKVIEKLASPMDRLAYGGDFTTMQALAHERAGLFEGKWNESFAPARVREVLEADVETQAEASVIAMEDTVAREVAEETIGRRKSTSWAVPVRSKVGTAHVSRGMTAQYRVPAPVAVESEDDGFEL